MRKLYKSSNKYQKELLMKSNQKIHQANLSKWTSLFQKQADSGLTVKEWCSQNSLSIHAFYYWKRIAKEAYVSSIMPEIVPLPIENLQPIPASDDEHELYKLRESSEEKTNSVTISIGDIHIEIGSNASDEMISGIIKAVRHA